MPSREPSYDGSAAGGSRRDSDARSGSGGNLSRRRFLRNAGGVAAAPLVVTSSFLRAQPPSERIAVGIIGVGQQCWHVNMPPFLHAADSQVVAVCDVDSWRLQRARRRVNEHYASQNKSGRYRGCSAYEDYRELLARPEIDAVMISTPDHWHVPVTMAAASAGKHICLEKPVCYSIHEGRLLCEAVERYGVVFRTDEEFRSLRCFHRACELVVNGRIGDLHTIHAGSPEFNPRGIQAPTPVPDELNYDMWLGPAPLRPYVEARVHPRQSFSSPGWYNIRDFGYGWIANWGVHLIDVAQWGNQTDRTGPVEVEGTGTYPENALDDALVDFDVNYRYANGVRLHYEMSRPYVRFEGSEGWVQAEYNGRQVTAEPSSLLDETIRPEETKLPFKQLKRDFLDCVKSRRRTVIDQEVGHRDASICYLGQIAIDVGKKLKWDPERERFLNSSEANRLVRRPAMRAPWNLY